MIAVYPDLISPDEFTVGLSEERVPQNPKMIITFLPISPLNIQVPELLRGKMCSYARCLQHLCNIDIKQYLLIFCFDIIHR